MRKFTIAFLRNAKPSLHSDAFLTRCPPLSRALASVPDLAEVGASPLPKISVGALETRKANVRKARELKADKLGCGSLHAEISPSIAWKAKPTSANGNRKAKAGAKEVFKPEDAIVLAEETAAKAEETALHAKFVFEEEKAVQNAAITDRSEEINFNAKKSTINAKREIEFNAFENMINATKKIELNAIVSMVNANEVMINANESMIIAAMDRSEDIEFNDTEKMINAKKELSEWVAKKLDLNTFRRGTEWVEIAFKLLDYGISTAHVKKMLPKCRNLYCTNNMDSTLKHFTMLGMSHEQMGRVISISPSVLSIPNNMFQSNIDFFESVGIDRCSLGKVMHIAYRTVSLSPSTVQKRSEFWKNYLQDVRENAFRTLILRSPQILASNLRTVKLSIAYLEELGSSKTALLRVPLIMSRSVNVIAKRLKVLDQLGILNARNHIRALTALQGLSSLKLQERLHNLLAWGFSFEQVKKITVHFPYVLSITEDSFNLKLSYAVNVMNLSFDVLAARPTFWGHSYEKRIKYRYEVLQELKTLGAYKRNICLGYMLSMTEADFSRKFVGKLHSHTKHPTSS